MNRRHRPPQDKPDIWESIDGERVNPNNLEIVNKTISIDPKKCTEFMHFIGKWFSEYSNIRKNIKTDKQIYDELEKTFMD